MSGKSIQILHFNADFATQACVYSATQTSETTFRSSYQGEAEPICKRSVTRLDDVAAQEASWDDSAAAGDHLPAFISKLHRKGHVLALGCMGDAFLRSCDKLQVPLHRSLHRAALIRWKF